MNHTIRAIDALHARYLAAHEQAQQSMLTDYIEAWSAPCYVPGAEAIETEEGEVLVPWRAVLQEAPADFTNVERALALTIDEGVKCFFNRYWAGDLHCLWEQHELTLLQVQSEADMDRLQENLIGHVLMKRRLKQPETFFIGVGGEDDLLITVAANSGKVGLEYVGKEQHHGLAADMESFLNRIEPRLTKSE